MSEQAPPPADDGPKPVATATTPSIPTASPPIWWIVLTVGVVVVAVAAIIWRTQSGTETASTATTVAPTTTRTTLPPTTTIPKKKVTGTLMVWGEKPTKFGIAAGQTCDGSDISIGYYDIRSSAPVYVNDIQGNIIDRTELDTGFVTKDNQGCCFTFSVELEKGSDKGKGFVFALDKTARRGDTRITWDDIEKDEASVKLALTIGTPKDSGLTGPGSTAGLECAAKAFTKK